MKNYILLFMSIAMLMTMVSCSSSDDEVAENNNVEGKLVPMTFTATQETNVGTRTALNNGTEVFWKSGNQISVFDGEGDDHNQMFTLQGTGESKSGTFSGEASSSATKFTAVYPYTSGAQLDSDGSVSGITLPAEQTATADSFDPNAALMMAVSTESNKNQLDFKNAVSLVKITTAFACKKIVLTANEDIAGKGTLKYIDNAPSITFDSGQFKTITLKPASESGKIEIGTYYIVVPSITMTGFSISFDASDEYCVYTRTSTKSNTFNRSKIKDLGTFKIDGTWTHTSRGKVNKNDEVDMGVFTIEEKKYRVIFTKSNLTKDGLAAKESDYGDYFAWGATEPLYTSYTRGVDGKVTVNAWESGKDAGYVLTNAPYNDGSSSYTQYTTAETNINPSDDPARNILLGDWQLPTKAVWNALYNANKGSVNWGIDGNLALEKIDESNINGMKITKTDDATTYLFLPAAGDLIEKQFGGVGAGLHYWSGTTYSSTWAYYLFFQDAVVYPDYAYERYSGFTVRPVRLVAVD